MLLSEPTNAESAAYLEKERAASGYMKNLEWAWAWRPDVAEEFARLRKLLAQESGSSPGEMAMRNGARVRRLVLLAGLGHETRRGTDPADSTAGEGALRQWARQVARDPNGASASQVEPERHHHQVARAERTIEPVAIAQGS